jgi:hypothetical protein
MIYGAFLLLPHQVAAIHPAEGEIQSKEVIEFEGEHPPLWYLKAKKPYLIGGYGDNFNYDGSRVTPLLGKAKVILDVVKDTGTIVVSLTGTINPEKGKTYTGKIKIYYRIATKGPAFWEGGVADFIYLHGDTKQGPPVMPKTRTFLGVWGYADVYVNGELVYEGLDGHVMYTERTRDTATKAIYNKDKSGFYSHKDPANSSIAAPNETEIHFVAHSMDADKENFPPHSVWIHLNFEKVVDLSYGSQKGFTHSGKYGAGGGCGFGGGCAMAGGKCGAGCGCGCGSGGGCAMTGGKCGAGGCAIMGGGHGAAVGKCGPGCGCGCLAGGTDIKAVKCGPGCGCGCATGGPCSCNMR